MTHKLKTPEILVAALRQYQHNDCSGLLAGFDHDEVVKIVTLQMKKSDEKTVEILLLKDKLRFIKPFVELSKEQMYLPDGFLKMIDDNFWDGI